MSQDRFPRKQVERSFRKFNDCVEDVLRATFGTWDNAFRHLMNHCENDPIMRVVIDPLRGCMAEKAADWYETTQPSDGFLMPDDDEERLAMMYQIMLLIYRGSADLLNVAFRIDFGSASDDSTRIVDDQIIHPFAREVSYRLDDIIEDTAGADQIERAALVAFHLHDNTIHAGPGSVIAAGGSTITGSKATYTYKVDPTAALESMRAHIDDVAADQREAIAKSISLLIRSIDDNTVPRSEVEAAAGQIAASSDVMRRVLRDLSLGTAGSLLATAIQHVLGD